MQGPDGRKISGIETIQGGKRIIARSQRSAIDNQAFKCVVSVEIHLSVGTEDKAPVGIVEVIESLNSCRQTIQTNQNVVRSQRTGANTTSAP